MSRTLTLDYPESLPDSLQLSPGEFEQEAKLAMAVKLFETGWLSSTQAAALAGLPKVVFLHELNRFAVSPIQTEADELACDLTHADQALNSHQRLAPVKA
ncbi:MAG: UPF0175 family protein [Verrucomicrobiae bacterium]|nr:UPF0175 family protein [Verrucomicrobiae bacterium]